MYCVECGEALESILERMRKVCSVCYFGHRFRAEHRPADLAPGRPPYAEGEPDGSPSWGLAGDGDRDHDSSRIVLHIPQGDPKDGPAVRDLVEELSAQVHGQGERLEARRWLRTEVIARAERAVARARLAQERTAALLARLESSWGIGPGRARKTGACPAGSPSGHPPSRSRLPTPQIPPRCFSRQ